MPDSFPKETKSPSYASSEHSSIVSANSYNSSAGNSKTRGYFRNFIDSYKRADPSQLHNARSEDVEDGIASIRSDTQFKKSLSSRHVIMMSLGTGIGTGLLVANAKGLYYGGPGSLIIGYVLVSFVTYFMIQAAGEMAVAYPTLPGNFNAYQSIFISKSWGFATVWLFCIQWLTVLPLELITSSLTIKYWNDKINADIFVMIFYVFLVAIHLVGGIRAYGETEFLFNSCKILMVIGFIILSIVINAGGAGNDGYIGGKYWHEPGSFAEGDATSRFKGICLVLVSGYFSYGGTELYVLSVNEQAEPRKATPAAAKKSIYRILIIYLLTMILIGFNVPHNNDQLMGAGGSATHASPYVLAATIHGVKIVPHFINAVILISVISVANSSLFAGPRLLSSLATQGYAPKILSYVDREGRPLVALGISFLIGLIAFVSCTSHEEEVFTWLAAIAGLSEIFTWSGIMFSHVRFRAAMKVQGKDINELGYKANTGVWGSAYGAFFGVLVLIAQFWVALAPIGNGGKCDAEAFFESYLAFPIWVACYFGYMIYNKDFTLLSPLDKIDLDSYRRIYDPELIKQEDEENKENLKSRPLYYKIYRFWC
ncbi:hypothetical protein Kpol_1065p13 [Vanderwaltozyma polyspora DSM 70294]|uniref:Amino acid permease/ SLC12A domain-containing protein n=1 Tax=Vanderwaltozyma polyspora (strain ATCC 22028 / DSM 70294 / BCRC 21397 / CBS 2163 / NBRC 10782 / NRRL Y-8283 / UCD 57-17) TaxID=436907 RepID=A7TL35_VANPO|nr:uncharacterized protein Kpol_1065p13 [Vanderwaltozyma polyspora DSM 70294]EDO16998.1 hypothetical protein Kpol_1065p13 [Vanderwaltozyma polyspora DSM 70294]